MSNSLEGLPVVVDNIPEDGQEGWLIYEKLYNKCMCNPSIRTSLLAIFDKNGVHDANILKNFFNCHL
jgi:hypothetical protein